MINARLKLFLLIIFIVSNVATLLFSQQKFQIEGSGKQIIDNDIIYLSYRIEGRYVLDSTIVKNNSFRFKGNINNTPIKANLYRNQNPTHNYDFIDDLTTLYLEKGVVKVISPDTLKNSVISGTAQNNTFQVLKARLAPLNKERQLIKDPDFFSDEERKDTLLVINNSKLIEANHYKSFDIQLTFAKEYTSSFVSLDIVNNIARDNNYIHQAQQVFHLLSPELQQLPEAEIAKQMFLKKNRVSVGALAPEFEMMDMHENKIKLSKYRGKYLLLDFWASWCLPCRQEHPNLLTVYSEYKDSNFDILSVSIDSKKDKWINAVVADGLLWSQVSDLKASNSEVHNQYGISTIPCNFLLDPQGKVIAKDLKGQALKDKMLELFPPQ